MMIYSENRECVPSCLYPFAVLAFPMLSKTGFCRSRKRCKASWQVACKHGDTDKGRTPSGRPGTRGDQSIDQRMDEATTKREKGSRVENADVGLHRDEGRKTEDELLKPTCQITQDSLVLIRSRRNSY